MHRRGFLLGLGAVFAAPAIVRATSLMPVHQVDWWTDQDIIRELCRRLDGGDGPFGYCPPRDVEIRPDKEGRYIRYQGYEVIDFGAPGKMKMEALPNVRVDRLEEMRRTLQPKIDVRPGTY